MVFYRSILIMGMKNKNKLYLIIIIVSAVVVLVCLAGIVIMLFSFKQAREDYSQLAMQVKDDAGFDKSKIFWDWEEKKDSDRNSPDHVEIPVDFDFLLEKNQDIIGWIMVEGTTIDYPILYDTTFNQYYLSHNYKGTNAGGGSIVVLPDNTKDFTDFNTVLYGHNLLDGSMFSQLHQFRKKEFFDEHGQIVIFTPDRKLTYQVFAAYRNDKKNIIVNNDFSTEELRAEYIGRIYENTAVANFNSDCWVKASDRILTLSTCIGNPAYRYLVQGVLVSEEPGYYIGSQSADEGSK